MGSFYSKQSTMQAPASTAKRRRRRKTQHTPRLRPPQHTQRTQRSWGVAKHSRPCPVGTPAAHSIRGPKRGSGATRTPKPHAISAPNPCRAQSTMLHPPRPRLQRNKPSMQDTPCSQETRKEAPSAQPSCCCATHPHRAMSRSRVRAVRSIVATQSKLVMHPAVRVHMDAA